MVAAGGISPLLAACKAGHTDILEMLLDHDGVDVNRTGAGAEATGPQGGGGWEGLVGGDEEKGEEGA